MTNRSNMSLTGQLSSDPEATTGRARPWLRPVIFLCIAAVIFAAWFILPVKDYLTTFLAWLEDLGATGLVILGCVYVLACVLLVPGSLLTLGAGFLAAAIWPTDPLLAVAAGTVTVSIASTTGACAAFGLGRSVARNWIAGKVSSNAKFSAIDDAVGRSGFKMVFLVRLSPIFPFNLLNYALGLTKVRFGAYFLASWIGMLPGTVMYVYIGSVTGSLTALATGETETPPAQRWLLVAGLAATAIVVVLVTRIARRALNEAVAKTKEERTL